MTTDNVQLWVPSKYRSVFNKKADPPKTGPSFGRWAGENNRYFELPGGTVLQFDLSRLTLADFRAMRDHYQVNVSSTVLTFMIHQIEWEIRCDDQKISDFIEANMRLIWTPLIRAIGTAFWAGYSPNSLEYDNGREGITISRIKDLLPEDCRVNWKQVEGYAPPSFTPPKFNVYDGIKQFGAGWPIPPENTFWYPLLMENGDYYGRKLLKPAFPSWFFSMLIHLFANRYYERYGEPVPKGRADFDQQLEGQNGQMVSGRQAMQEMLLSLRNRSVLVLPNERDQDGKNFTWDVEYLESQMRGADFERYLNRLDEEISLALFTPTLLMRTADVGSYNLGVGHMQMYLWMLNALAGDIKSYIDEFIVERLKQFNFSPNAPRAEWVPKKMGKQDAEVFRSVVAAIISGGKAMPDLEELGTAIGLTLNEVQQITAPADNPPAPAPATAPANNNGGPKALVGPRQTAERISARITGQVTKAWRDDTFGKGFRPTMGYRAQFCEALVGEGAEGEVAQAITDSLFDRLDSWMAEAVALGKTGYSGPEEFLLCFNRLLDIEIDGLVAAA